MSKPVVIGVGNRMRGDDAVGCMVIDELAGFDLAATIDAGNAPENYIQPVTQLAPGRVLVVDACDLGARPGEFRLLDRRAIEDLSYGLLSTHTLPLTLTIEMLVQETGAEVQLLGIQPGRIEFGQGLSEEVAQALPAVVRFVRDWSQA
jgi:hydrogenase 3 maturation protease